MQQIPHKILIIQTAFIGDAILASSLIETWKKKHPNSIVDLLIRKGNESLFDNNPNLNELIIWNKKQHKYTNLFQLISKIRKTKYDAVFNIQRFFAMGLLTAFSAAKVKVGYQSNPLSFLFTHSIPFSTDENYHEIERNAHLIKPFCDQKALRPKLYPSVLDFNKTSKYKRGNYVCMAPTSVWYTKQWPKENWVSLINKLPATTSAIYLLGAPNDFEACEEIRKTSNNERVSNLAGKLFFLESAALMKDARMNYVNDSAPMHIASSVNAPITAIYCSTIPAFGFGPLSDNSVIIESEENLSCRPCGLHGKKECPEGHFNCSNTANQLIINNA
jgi:heptosyltransferase-2